MPTCAAKGCSNSSWKNKKKMCYFPIKEPERCAIWIKELNRENWTPSKHSALCEEHFAPEMWEKQRIDGLMKLKRNAIPTLFGNIGSKQDQTSKANLDVRPQGEASSSSVQHKNETETIYFIVYNENDTQHIEDESTSEKLVIYDEATNDVIKVENNSENNMDTNIESANDIDTNDKSMSDTNSSSSDVRLTDDDNEISEVPNPYDNLNTCYNCFKCEKKMKEMQKRYAKLLHIHRKTQRKLISANYEIKRLKEKIDIFCTK